MEQSREVAIANARLVLKQAGYFVDNLWHVNDVKDKFECDDDTAQKILKQALTHPYIVERIFDVIQDESWNQVSQK
jgi:hypothetical protein